MSRVDAIRLLETDEDPHLIRKWLAPGLAYPFWYLLTPAGAQDPWLGWWFVGACFVGIGIASYTHSAVRDHLRTLHLGCCWLVTLQLFWLASVNEMHPFYAVGSILAVLGTSMVLPTPRSFLFYGGFVVGLTLASFAVAPGALKLAYWLPLPTVLGVLYYRLQLHRQAVELVRRSQDDLERRVERRTRQLSEANAGLRREMDRRERAEEQLRHSQKMEAVGRLAGGIAHDFNNLLTAMWGYAELLLAEVRSDSPLRADLLQLRRTVRSASSLTNQLLTFSRSDAIRLTSVDLNDVLEEMQEMLGAVLGEDVELEFRLQPDAGCVRGDPSQIEQVILNLALNARDAMPAGGALTVETRRIGRSRMPAELNEECSRDAYVQLVVTDTGSGMDEETRARIFEPFFTTKDMGKGTGLGLSTVYGILKQDEGHFRVTSEPGKGSCFELYWPRVRPIATRTDPADGTIPEAAHGDERILLVEDDDDVRRVLRRALAQAGYDVLDADGGPAAMALLDAETQPIDLVVTDAVMPKMSGLSLAAHVRSRMPAARMLLISGHLNHASLRDQEVPAYVDFLRKPFDPRNLCQRVRQILDGDETGTATQSPPVSPPLP